MHQKKITLFVIEFLMLLALVCHAKVTIMTDGPIQINKSSTQGSPKTSSIQASINGHALSVVFTENLGTVHVEVTDTSGGPVDLTDMYTPNGYNAYIHHAGSYVVTFTLGNGDEYYGEFDVVE